MAGDRGASRGALVSGMVSMMGMCLLKEETKRCLLV